MIATWTKEKAITENRDPQTLADDDLDGVQGAGAGFGDDGVLRTQGRTDLSEQSARKNTLEGGDKISVVKVEGTAVTCMCHHL